MSVGTVVTNANYLKERAAELVPCGPLVDIEFNGDGPIGMHIVNVPVVDTSNGERKSERVVVACAAEGSQAENRVFFGEQVIQVNGAPTKGMKMKEVKLMIADAERPVKVVLQPLCFKSSQLNDFPLTPPRNPSFQESDLLWGILSRSHALEKVGPERKVKPTTFVNYISIVPEFVFVRSPQQDHDILSEGDRIIEVDGQSGKAVLAALLRAKYPGSELTVQKVRVSGVVHCHSCNSREWIFSRFCSNCGTAQESRRL